MPKPDSTLKRSPGRLRTGGILVILDPGNQVAKTDFPGFGHPGIVPRLQISGPPFYGF